MTFVTGSGNEYETPGKWRGGARRRRRSILIPIFFFSAFSFKWDNLDMSRRQAVEINFCHINYTRLSEAQQHHHYTNINNIKLQQQQEVTIHQPKVATTMTIISNIKHNKHKQQQ